MDAGLDEMTGGVRGSSSEDLFCSNSLTREVVGGIGVSSSWSVGAASWLDADSVRGSEAKYVVFSPLSAPVGEADGEAGGARAVARTAAMFEGDWEAFLLLHGGTGSRRPPEGTRWLPNAESCPRWSETRFCLGWFGLAD